MTQRSKPDSPCINVCSLDAATQICVGCFRTIQEIAEWSAYSDEQRARVRGELAARRARTIIAMSIQVPRTNQDAAPNQRCQVCGAEFVCGMSNAEAPCWCEGLPHIAPPNPSSANCLCPVCLGGIIQRE
jgi:uncharacterized protein